ncbi:hypothetical protein [Tautonia sociabilis]|uniref:Uncharacterized protein n=1 Tax=Tautonia sociabilis TaxID=2080755 RepID=A0A432MC31_9BACT|nr:hypothetical protein [Tautonia sociabilis]RUL81584.1 hypothetical protein TsocGM_24955 [Tautonia sociabilis]
MLPSMFLPTLLWLGQSPGITFLAPMPPGPQPDYARPVLEQGGGVIPPDPVIVCIHRPAELPFDRAQVDRAASRIHQVLQWSRLREARSFATLGPPAGSPRRLIPRQTPSPSDRLRLRALSDAIDRHWQLFEARLSEVRMFQHRPEEAQLACQRAAEAWDALLGLIQQAPNPLPADLAEEVAEVDGLVELLRFDSF